jgi:hypothetical protein
MYSARQRDLRRRRQHAAPEEPAYWLSDQVAAIEIEDGIDFEAQAPIPAVRRGRATAA